MKPIIPPKYDVGFIVPDNNLELIKVLEPWCSNIYCDSNLRKHYITVEQEKSSFDLSERVLPYNNEKNNNILVEIDGTKFSKDDFNFIQNLSAIIQDSGEEGTFELGNLSITINSLQTFENELIKCE